MSNSNQRRKDRPAHSRPKSESQDEAIRSAAVRILEVIEERVPPQRREARAREKLLTIDDLSTYLQVSKRTIETEIRLGKIPVLWVRGQRRFDPKAISCYLRAESKSRSAKNRKVVK